MRSRLVKVALLATLCAAIPSVALAATGWKSTKFLSGNGFTGKSVITRCGSELGNYTLHGTVYVKGADKLTEVVTVPLKGDHKAHLFHLDSMGGPAYRKLTKSNQKKLFNQVAAVIDHVKLTVLSVSGKTLHVKEIYKGKAATGTISLKTYSC